MKASILQAIRAAVEKLGFPQVEGVLEHPKELSHGDWASNVALIIAKQVGKNPQEVAQAIAAELRAIDGVEKVGVAGAGFMNFTLARNVFVQELTQTTGDTWGQSDLFKGKKVLVEHSSPNLFKPFHIGHLMNNTIGESITRLAKYSGATVSTMSFPSDISLGVAKAVFVLLEKYGSDFNPSDVSVLGDAYVEGTKRYEDDESIQLRVKEIADNLYAGKDSPEWNLFQKCKTLNIKYFEDVVAGLGSHFDSYIYESEAGVDGKRIVMDNLPRVFTESDGAIIYTPDESSKLHTSVFINSQGNPTYEAKDIGLLHLKFDTYHPDLSIFITDVQQTSHFDVVLDAAGKIEPVWKERSLHRVHGRMSFKGQKMSSRLGGVPLAEEVLQTVIEEVKVKNPDITPVSAKAIGIAAIKFAILRAQAGKNIDFDPDTSLSFEGDSGPYLQYSAVRAASVLEKAREQGLSAQAGITPDAANPVAGSELLERLIARFPEVVARSQGEWAPHHIVTYLLELAQSFNSWYGQYKIIDEDKAVTVYRLAIVAAVRQTLINGLWLLGISVPEKM